MSKVASQLTVNKGAYRFDDVSFGSSFKEPNKKRSVLEVAAGGTLSVGTLDFSNGDVQIGGQLNADKLVWEDKQYGNETTHVSGPEGTITVNAEGVLTTVAKDNLAKQDEAGKWTTTEVVEHITNNGTLEITDAFSAKASDVKDYLAKAESAFGGEVVFKNVTLTDEKVEWAPELGMITLNTTVALPEADDQGVAPPSSTAMMSALPRSKWSKARSPSRLKAPVLSPFAAMRLRAMSLRAFPLSKRLKSAISCSATKMPTRAL